MTEFIILDKLDMQLLLKDQPTVLRIDNKPYVICTEKYYKSQRQNEYFTTQEEKK